jgi:predicted enzyme related to lactoylglutathione lyase
MSKAHFGFTKLIVNDLEKTVAFYKEVCGLEEWARVSADVDGREIDEIMLQPTAENGATLVLWKWRDRDAIVVDEVILGFQTPDVTAFVQRVRDAGGTIVQGIKDMPEHGVRVAFVTDVEGHLIEVVELLQA